MSDDDDMISVRPEVVTLVRAMVIGEVARQIVAAFDVDDTVLETVLKGFQGRYLEQVELIIHRADGGRPAYLSVSVDWERHRVIMEDDSSRKSFEVDPNRSLLGQVAPALDLIMARVLEARKRIRPVRCRAVYTYRSGQREAGREALGTVALTPADRGDLAEAKKGARIGGRDGGLGEVTVDFRYDSGG
ncbi:hypothetical protein [Actinomadura macrotermitis]|uniref:Uncharacterized protein n=1 Tax=Actinomadura macrotermitis TaxID=2585200 RepID=A0A7K0C719_9ACTN|nr:hypothetical protein [Actinomadura macrotermitis]MQY09269.1 hypothetical protein [Actinomadura macrotermitis]